MYPNDTYSLPDNDPVKIIAKRHRASYWDTEHGETFVLLPNGDWLNISAQVAHPPSDAGAAE